MERLKALRSRRSELVKQNRREVYLEAKAESSAELDLQDEEKGLENADDDSGDDQKGQLEGADESVNVLSYTVAEDEEWKRKQGLKRDNAKNIDSINDFKNVAARTYRKQIEENSSKTNNDEAEKRERDRKYQDLKDQGYTDVEIRTLLTDKKMVKDESNRVKAFEARVYKQRGAKLKRFKKGTDNAINERNRAFNEKLNRESKANSEND